MVTTAEPENVAEAEVRMVLDIRLCRVEEHDANIAKLDTRLTALNDGNPRCRRL